jgi:hypothetical protein
MFAIRTTAILAFSALLSGCVYLLGPADAVLPVSGEIAASATGPCSLRMLAVPSQEVMSTRSVSGSFETSFMYHAAARAKVFRFELSCGQGPWVAVGDEVPLRNRRSSLVSLGKISP